MLVLLSKCCKCCSALFIRKKKVFKGFGCVAKNLRMLCCAAYEMLYYKMLKSRSAFMVFPLFKALQESLRHCD